MFSYTQSMTYFGFQISTFHNQIVVRSFRSNEYSEVDNIPVFIYVKTNNVYNLRSQYAINKLSQVFVCQTSDGTSHYITNTYEHGNLDRRINIHDTNNQKTTVFFNGNPMNQSFRRPTNDFLVERRDIAVNDTFLFVRTKKNRFIFHPFPRDARPNFSRSQRNFWNTVRSILFQKSLWVMHSCSHSLVSLGDAFMQSFPCLSG